MMAVSSDKNSTHLAGEYFVETREKVKQYATYGIIDLRKLKTEEFQERWEKIENSLTVPG